MSLHVIVGAGPVGTATATLLADRGERVRMVTRSGSGPELPAVERVAADASDPDRLARLTDGATALYNCANPAYDRWLTDWPPLSASLLATAERTGAVLATASCLYGYGPVDATITPDTPLAATHPKLAIRATMWRDAERLHRAGRIRATEILGSDYIESNSVLTWFLAAPLRAGRRVYLPTALDAPHSFTAIRDMARTLVAVAGTETAWGRAWLVPSATLTVRQIAGRFARAAGAPAPRLTSLPYPVLWAAGLRNMMLRELRTTHYQWARPFTVDGEATRRAFGIEPTPLDTSLAAAAA